VGRHDLHDVRVLGAPDVDLLVKVLSEAFFEYPVMRFVLGSPPDYVARLEQLLTFFVMARVLRNEVLLGVRDTPGLKAAALVWSPGAGRSPPALKTLREETWASLGAASRARYETFGAATAPFAVVAPHFHLDMIGVARSWQGRGVARSVLEAVHELSASDESSTGVTLTTELEANVPLYEHFGYEVIGRATVASALNTWVMYRRNC
jgi:GNAT superfamily N-acetyltransferase